MCHMTQIKTVLGQEETGKQLYEQQLLKSQNKPVVKT